MSFRMMSRLVSLNNWTPVRRKDLGDLVYMMNYIRFCVKFRSVVVEFFCHHSIATPKKTLLRARILEIFPIQIELQYILSKISLPWQQGLIVVEFVWHHSIALPRKPPATCKNLGDISRTSWVIAYFVSNFVAIATGGGRGRICFTSCNSLTPKTPDRPVPPVVSSLTEWLTTGKSEP